MRIYNKGRGVHDREIIGIEKLQKELPSDWMAFTNLELALPHGGREIDVIMIIEDRVLAIDLKDWRGKIESAEGIWFHNGKATEGRSPVEKILSNKRDLSIQLERYLKQQSAARKSPSKSSFPIPKVDGCVVLTGTTDLSGIAQTEINRVFTIDQFIKMLKNTKQRITELGGVAPDFHSPVILSPEWKNIWASFFNVKTGPFKVSSRRYGSFQAESDSHSFQHKDQIYTEYDVVDESAGGATGLLRRWDFTKADTRFQNEEARREIAGREREVIAWLNDRNPLVESSILQPRVDDPDKGIDYWEVFDRRRRLQRLKDLSSEQVEELGRDVRIELVRQVLLRAKLLHDLKATHLDLGSHSVWIESPSVVRLSHLMAASYPEIRSLGSNRYQFLSSVTVPDDVLDMKNTGHKKDVFLLGCIAHQLLFGEPPVSVQQGDPPEWNAMTDTECAFGELHPWFERAMAWDPESRFNDAGEMLAALNLALAKKPSAKEILEGLERFRTVPSQMKLFREYPAFKELRDDARMAMWLSEIEEQRVLVKMWKREGWGEQSKEAARLLAFLEQAEALITDHPGGCVPLRRAIWLGDALVLVQDYLNVPNLSESRVVSPDAWSDRAVVLPFIKALAQAVVSLHERQISHGDLKPDNILVDGNTPLHPMLVDLLDFVPVDDGERLTTAYAPPSGDRYDRDRFAVSKIAEELLAAVSLSRKEKEIVNKAFKKIRQGPPENSTLLPLLEALDVLLSPSPDTQERKLLVSIPGVEARPFLSDEGQIGLRLAAHGRQLRLRGATEQLVFDLDLDGRIVSARRMEVDQKQISIDANKEFAMVDASIDMLALNVPDYSSIVALLSEPEIEPLWRSARVATFGASQPTADQPDEAEEAGEENGTPSEAAFDQLSETISEQASFALPDVPTLWRRLIDVEAELTIEGTAIGPSAYRQEDQRHIVPFDLESGGFDFPRDDTVTVFRLDKGEKWTRIGYLDLATSNPAHLEITTGKWGGKRESGLVSDGQRLRFESHFEVTSRSRRRDATLRVLARESRVANLVDVFDTGSELAPTRTDVAVDPDLVTNRYGLNAVQAQAFANLIAVRPVGLLQGPPGTGKTRFIAALVHYAITSGLARNVLLASQSHEAVNGAAEAVIKLFQGENQTPSILRVGHEGNVSDRLLPYHVARVENLLKDRFRAEQSPRLHVVGGALGIPAKLIDELITVETVIRPVFESLLQLQQGVVDEDKKDRIKSLQQTLETLVGQLGVSADLPQEVDDYYLEGLIGALAAGHSFANAAKIKGFTNVALLGRDFMGSVSTRHRTFETFLAGTRQIVAGTCVGLGRSSLELTSTPFDLVIVDEAARCAAGELAVPLQSGRWVVLVGDHRQLEPQHKSEVVQSVAQELHIVEREVVRSDFERVFESPYGQVAGYTLTEQYRMLPPIGHIASTAFYGGKLTHGRQKPIIDAQTLPDSLDKPLMWLTTDAFGEAAYQKEASGRNGALENELEAELIIDLIRSWDADDQFREWLERQTDYPQAIGIICTYRAQSALIQKKLRRAFVSDVMRAAIKIDTVDSYQGKENPIVVLSLVRNNADGRIEDGVKTIREGFMSRSNRLNVAVSRAMDRLVLVGASARWRSESPMGKIAQAYSEQAQAGEARYIDAVVFKTMLEGDEKKGSGAKKKQRTKDTGENSK